MSKHIDTVTTSCARTLYGLRTLRAHGLPQASLQLIFRTTALTKLLYAAPAWWGFANSGDINRLEAFLRRAGKSGYNTGDFTIAALCEQADEQLFRTLKYNPIHPLHPLLPSERSAPYLTHSRVHNYELPSKNSSTDECNFIYGTACCTRTAISVLIFYRFYLCLTAVCLLFSIKTKDILH